MYKLTLTDENNCVLAEWESKSAHNAVEEFLASGLLGDIKYEIEQDRQYKEDEKQ